MLKILILILSLNAFILLPSAEAQRRRSQQQQAYTQEESDEPPHRLTFDLGASVGNYNDKSYTEAEFGVNFYFKRWLMWRNALFSRFTTGSDTIYGLDTSMRGIFSVGGSALGFTTFAGPGYRFVNKGDNAPFFEAGLILKTAGLAIGGGAKVLYYSNPPPGIPNQDTQYFIILAGGGSL